MKWILLAAVLVGSTGVYSQKYTISGYVKDRTSGENLIGANIYQATTLEGTAANAFGFFSLTLPSDSIILKASCIGYESMTINLSLGADTTLNIELEPSAVSLNEVVVVGSLDEDIQESSRMSTIDIPIDNIKAMPAFMGEVDVLKVIQLLPGVQSGSEGSSGLYVRGGGPDQNLILLDGVPVYNASHLFGFFSVFNADAINHVELIKGGFPARYGGRLSSVIDINLKEGNNKKIKGEGSIGLVASKLTIEGPIKKDKTSFIVSGRRTYIDILGRPIIKASTDGDVIAGYYFYDLNAKVNHHINNNNRIYLSTYTGEDKAYAKEKGSYNNGDTEYKDEFGLKWGNITTALRWNHIFNPKLFSNITATYSRYRFLVFSDFFEKNTFNDETTTSLFKSEYTSGIRDFAWKADFDFIPNPRHYIRFGAQTINHLFTPGAFNFQSSESDEDDDLEISGQKKYANEFLAYFEDDMILSPKWKVNAGIHLSGFRVDGRLFHSIQPRLSMRYLATPALSFKASYATMTQYIHLLTNAGIGLPTDLWVPATAKVKPENSQIFSAGLAYKLNHDMEFSLEGYYKEMTGLVEYKDGASFVDLESDWQDKIEMGNGESYGAELLLQRKLGRVTGWIGYTLSWTNRTFPNINFGKTFPFKYDRRHDIELTMAYHWTENKQFSFTWVFGTGNAITLPNSSYAVGSVDYPVRSSSPYYNGSSTSRKEYDSRNNYRMNAYHRMDISYSTTKKTKWGERTWSIGVYNFYNRRNPFFIDLDYDSQGRKKFIQYSLFPLIPSISYQFKF